MKTQLLLVLALVGCQKKAEDAPASAPKPSGDMAPEPVGKAPAPPPTQPSPDPAPAAGQVRAPTAADLADYVAKLPGNGSKILAQIDTSQGTIHCELFGDKTPMTVANFVGLATGMKPWLNPKTGDVEKNKPYFDGLTFHRVIAGFMIQGGDPLGQGIGGPGYQFANESTGLEWKPGTLAMANAGPNTNGSQFFICHQDLTGRLPKNYTIFGQVTKGLDIVDKIAAAPRNARDLPDQPVAMTKVAILDDES